MTAEVGISRVTDKGQITIPSNIRNQKGIKPGSSLIFIELEDGILVKTTDELQALFGLYEDQARKTGLTQSELGRAVEKEREKTVEQHGL